MDFDGDGTISRDDIERASQRDGRDPNSKEIKVMFEQADADKDGLISFVWDSFFTHT